MILLKDSLLMKYWNIPWIVKNTNYSQCEIKNNDSNEFRSFVDEDVIEELKYRRSFIEKKIR